MPRWAGVAWASLWCAGLLAPSVAALGEAHHPVWAVIDLVVAGSAFLLATADAASAAGPRRPWLWPVVVLQALATAGLVADGGLPWATLPLLLVIAVGVAVPLRVAPWLVVVVAVAAAVTDHARGAAWDAALLSTGLTTLLAGMLTCAFGWLALVIAELHRTRDELSRTAVAAERLRFSRDLHDLLGHSLSVVSVKAQAAQRAVRADPAAAEQHAADIAALSQEALREVREAVQGYRGTSLDAEVDRAAQSLRAAGIVTEVERGDHGLDPAHDELLAWVVREGATNVLRHGRAAHARIRTRTDREGVTVLIENDGGGPDADEDTLTDSGGSLTGSGLVGLRERLLIAGGELSTHGDTTGFTLSVRLPHTDHRGRPATRGLRTRVDSGSPARSREGTA
ncbi:hypothetical protein GCM10027517_20200 [Phycicoccus ginsengisoli]